MRTKEELPACPVATAVSLIGGKWKLLILRNLKVRPWRFNELQRDIDGIFPEGSNGQPAANDVRRTGLPSRLSGTATACGIWSDRAGKADVAHCGRSGGLRKLLQICRRAE